MKGPRFSVTTKASVIAAGIVSTALAMGTGWAQTPPAGPQRYGYGPGMMWGGGWYGLIFGPLFMIFSLVVVIAGVALLVRWLGGAAHGTPPLQQHAPPARTPLDILKERFARGEIDKDEFEERRRVLGE